MKRLWAFLLCAAMLAGMLSGCGGKAPISGTESKEQQATETEATVDDGKVTVWIVKTRNTNGRLFEVSYDENYMVTHEVYSEDGEEKRRYNYTSNEDGLLTEILGQGQIELHYTMTYDENGTMTESKTYNSDGTVDEEFCYTYNEQGQLTQTSRYYYSSIDSRRRLDERIVNEYDSDGLLLCRYVYISEDDSRLDRKFTYSYNDAGQCISCEEFVVYDERTMLHAYTYNENGVLRKETVTNEADSSWNSECTWTVKTNEQGLVTYVYASKYTSTREYVYEQVRVTPEQAERILKNQEQFLSQDILMTMDSEIEKPLNQ